MILFTMSSIIDASVLNFNISFPEHKLLVADSLTECFSKGGEYLDAVFICRNSVCVRAHKVLLIQISDFLKRIVYDSRPSADTLYVSLPQVDSETMETFIKFLYEGVTKVNLQQLLHLKELLNFLDVRLTNFDIKSVSSEDDVLSTDDVFADSVTCDKSYKPAVLKPYSVENPSDMTSDIEITPAGGNHASKKLLATMPPAPLTKDQIDSLEKTYETNKYPTKEIYVNLAKELGISFRQVYVWFHEKRSKEKGDKVLRQTKPTEGNLVKKKKKQLNKIQKSSIKDAYKKGKPPIKKCHKELEPFLKFSAETNPSETVSDIQLEGPPVVIDDDTQRVLTATPSRKLSKDQISVLQSAYEKDKNPTREQCINLAKVFNIPFRQVYTWFLRKRRTEQADVSSAENFGHFMSQQEKGKDVHEAPNNKKGPIVCEICGKKFSHLSYLKIHNVKYGKMCKNISVGKKKKSKGRVCKTPSKPPAKKKIGWFVCETCGKGFSSEVYLRVHNVKYKKKCQNVSKNDSETSESSIEDVSQDAANDDNIEKSENLVKQYVCIVCNAKFDVLDDVTRHILRSHKDKLK